MLTRPWTGELPSEYSRTFLRWYVLKILVGAQLVPNSPAAQGLIESWIASEIDVIKRI